MEQTAQAKLEGMLKEMFPSLAKDILEVVEKQKEEIAALKAMGVDQKQIVERLQAETQKRVKLAVPGTDITTPAIYKGRRIDGMGSAFGVAPEYKEAIAKMYIDLLEMRMKNNHGGIQVAPDYMTKDLSEGSADAVGYLVFPEYISQILAFARQKSVALQDCRIINVGTDQVYIPMESTSVNTYWVNEATTLTQSEPVVGQLALTPKKLAAFSVLSNEVLADSNFDLVSWLTELFAESIAIELDKQVFNGSAFTGLIGAITSSAIDCAGAVTMAKLSDLIDGIPSNKSMGAKLYMHRNGFKKIRALEDTEGHAIYSPATAVKPMSVWEVPISLNEQFPSAVTDNSIIAVYGNLNHYIIAARKTGVTLEADPFGLFTKDQTRFRVVTRYHGAPWNVSAFAKMQI